MSFGILSAYIPTASQEVNRKRHLELLDDLAMLGYTNARTIKGRWEGAPEQSILVTDPNPAHILHLGQRYGQESVLIDGFWKNLIWKPPPPVTLSLHQRLAFGGRNLPKRVAQRYLMAGYYKLQKGTPIPEVIQRWSQDGDKALEDSMPVFYSVRELLPWREYVWSRKRSRPGYALVDGKKVWLSGPLKWDAIRADMLARGWDIRQPLIMQVGKDGNAKIGEGNHRLAIAQNIGLNRIPVTFLFQQRVSKEQPTTPEVSKPAIRRVMEEKRKTRKPATPEEQEQIDEIMSLLDI